LSFGILYTAAVYFGSSFLLWFPYKCAGHQSTLPFSIRVHRLLSLSCNSKSCDVSIRYFGRMFSKPSPSRYSHYRKVRFVSRSFGPARRARYKDFWQSLWPYINGCLYIKLFVYNWAARQGLYCKQPFVYGHKTCQESL
jgi:hypothetical protein